MRWRPFRRSGLTCREIVELVTMYLEGDLRPSVRRRFEAHIGSCEACTAYLAQMRETLRILGSVPHEPLPPRLEAELLTTFRDWRRG